MKIIKNEESIKRNGKVGGIVLLLCVIILVGGFYINANNMSAENPRLFYFTLASFVIGVILLQIGMYLLIRYGGKPRMDERVDASLKGLPGDFTVYHFTTPTGHLLIGPAGVWVLLPFHLRGIVEFSKIRWVNRGGGFLQWYMGIFGGERIGRPDLDAEKEVGKVKKLLAKHFEENQVPEVNAVLVFTNEQADIQAKGAPLPALRADQLKSFIRQKAKERPLNQIKLAAVKAALPE